MATIVAAYWAYWGLLAYKMIVPPQGLEGCLQPHRGSVAVATCGGAGVRPR